MFQKILVPLDGSLLAEKALVPALNLAKKLGAELLLVQAIQPQEMLAPAYGSYDFLWPEESIVRKHKWAQGYLNDLTSKYLDKDTKWSKLLDRGDAAGVIIEAAKDYEADLIVMTSHGRTGFNRWMLGSVTERVLQEASCPILVLRSDAEISNIMVTLDGSSLAETAIDPALVLAYTFGAKITFFRVEDQSIMMNERAILDIEQVDPGLAQSVREGYYNEAHNYLAAMLNRYRRDNLEINFETGSGNVAKQINQCAERHEVDLIAMTTHGRTGLDRWIYGSVAEKVLRSYPKSMLIVRPLGAKDE